MKDSTLLAHDGLELTFSVPRDFVCPRQQVCFSLLKEVLSGYFFKIGWQKASYSQSWNAILLGEKFNLAD
jgi:hypothetical protein